MLRTRPPLCSLPPKLPAAPLDLHVLGTPPAFTLSQDQTLQANLFRFNLASIFFGGCYSYFNDRAHLTIFIASSFLRFANLSHTICFVKTQNLLRLTFLILP